MGVVGSTPVFSSLFRVEDRTEAIWFEQFVTNTRVERFNEGVLRCFSGLNKGQDDLVFYGLRL